MAKLYTQKDSPVLAWKIQAAANYAGVPVTVVTDFKVDSADFQAKSPVAKIPVLETEEGSFFEADNIAYYILSKGKSTLLGANPAEAAQIGQWVQFAASEIDLPASVWTFPILGYIADNKAATGKAKGDIRKIFEQLNKFLATRTYLVGHRVTYADIAVAASLYHLYQLVLDASFRKAFVNVNRWYVTIVNQQHVKSAFGPVQLAEKVQVAPEAAPAPKEAPKKEEKPKEDKPKAAPKKKDADEEEEEENYEDDAPKGKNPLDLLPPPKMIMDDWKRMYSNNDTKTVAMPWFWQHFDANDYCLYFCRYKYNGELEKVFMSANLVGGFLQRLDKLRKYGFGAMILFGEDGKIEIEGAWLFRGTEIPAEMATVDDFELYDWKAVDTSSEQHKKLLEDYWAWEGSFAGREELWGQPVVQNFNQAKNFK